MKQILLQYMKLTENALYRYVIQLLWMGWNAGMLLRNTH